MCVIIQGEKEWPGDFTEGKVHRNSLVVCFSLSDRTRLGLSWTVFWCRTSWKQSGCMNEVAVPTQAGSSRPVVLLWEGLGPVEQRRHFCFHTLVNQPHPEPGPFVTVFPGAPQCPWRPLGRWLWGLPTPSPPTTVSARAVIGQCGFISWISG